MDQSKFIDKTSYIVALITLLLSFILFFSDTLEFMKSLAAAILLAALVWASYIMLRWLFLALRK